MRDRRTARTEWLSLSGISKCLPSGAAHAAVVLWGVSAFVPQVHILAQPAAENLAPQTVTLRADAGGRRFDGIGVVNGGGATSVLLKDYPEPQRSQILDLLYKPKFGASVGALLVEIPGDGNSTQGSMPSHMHTRDDLNYHRGYMWWIMQQARARNPSLTLTATPWSAPAWVGNGEFWSQDTADYDVKFLEGLRKVYGIEVTSSAHATKRASALTSQPHSATL